MAATMAQAAPKRAGCPECDWALSAVENSVVSIAHVSAELETHLVGHHRWEDARARAHGRAWAISVVDEDTGC